jgi:hypothetical protein
MTSSRRSRRFKLTQRIWILALAGVLLANPAWAQGVAETAREIKQATVQAARQTGQAAKHAAVAAGKAASGAASELAATSRAAYRSGKAVTKKVVAGSVEAAQDVAGKAKTTVKD